VSERPSGPSPENDDIDRSENDKIRERVKLEPIRTVTRELTRPDGSSVTVEVPVYPPFDLKDIPSESGRKPAAREKRVRSK